MASKPPPRWIARWERSRRMGRPLFIWAVGVVCLGIPTAVGGAVLSYFTLQPRPPILVACATGAIGTLVGGYAFGAITWHVGERRYARAMAQAENERRTSSSPT